MGAGAQGGGAYGTAGIGDEIERDLPQVHILQGRGQLIGGDRAVQQQVHRGLPPLEVMS